VGVGMVSVVGMRRRMGTARGAEEKAVGGGRHGGGRAPSGAPEAAVGVAEGRWGATSRRRGGVATAGARVGSGGRVGHQERRQI
jgi:hypothetical protein